MLSFRQRHAIHTALVIACATLFCLPTTRADDTEKPSATPKTTFESSGALVRIEESEPKFASIVDGKVKFHFSPKPRVLDARGKEEYELFKKQQSVLIRRNFVLHSVLKQPGMIKLSFFKGESDPRVLAARLRDAIAIDFPEHTGEMRIRVLADDPKEAVSLANSVKRAYLEEVVEAQRQMKLREFEELQSRYEAYRQQFLKKQAKLAEMERAYRDVSAEPARLAEKERAAARLEEIKKKATALSLEVHRMDLQIALLKKRVEDGEKVSDDELKRLVRQKKISEHDLKFYVKEYEKRVGAARRIKEYSDDLEVRRAEVEFVRAAVEAMRNELRIRELNMQAKPRIEDSEDATLVPKKDG